MCATDQEEKTSGPCPRREGFALQLNSLLSASTLARDVVKKDRRAHAAAVYGAALSTRRGDEAPAANRRIDAYINISATLAHAPDAIRAFYDVFHKMPARSVSCPVSFRPM